MKFMRSKKRIAVIAFIVIAALSVSSSAMVIDDFTLYEPPSTMYIRWYDYFGDRGGVYDIPSSNNSETDHPRWSAEYPYRAVFFGASYKSSTAYNSHVYIIYSKKPATDLFTFNHIGIDRGYADRNTKKGAVRAFIPKGEYGLGKDIMIVTAGAGDIVKSGGRWLLSSGTAMLSDCSFFSTYTQSGYNVIGDNVYFDFDFYYDCSAYHQSNTSLLSASGLRSVGGVPYNYIVRCNHDDYHEAPGGSGGSGGANQGGGGSGNNSGGSGGRPGWGSGEYGGGVDRDGIDKPDMDLDVPDDWRDPVEDNYNGGNSSEYKPDFPAYVPSEGDTGNNGSSWDLPAFDFENDGVSGEINGYKDLKPDGEQGLLELLPGIEDWGYAELVPDGQQGLIDFLAPFK